MTIDEAIESSDHLVNIEHTNLSERQKAGIRLGIEALKRENSYREYELKDKWYPLPGETKK